jgi:hypothetical protein
MRTILLSTLILSLASCADRAVYKSPDFAMASTKHRTIAILPVKIVQTGHPSKNVTPEMVKKENEALGYVFQDDLQSYVLRQTSRNKKGQVVSFQSVQKTNALLKEKGFSIEDLYNRQPEELALLLGVDAVLMTSLEKNRNFSDGAAYGIAAGRRVIGAITRAPTGIPSMHASDISLNSSLYDAKDSRLLWKTYRSGGAELPANVDGQIEYYCNWIARKLPYRS